MRLQFLLLLAPILPAHAEWTVYLTGLKGVYSAPAPPHTLAYFTHDALLCPETDVCTEEEKAAEEKAGVEKNSRAEVVKIGEVSRLKCTMCGINTKGCLWGSRSS
jgi:hypothetical protein